MVRTNHTPTRRTFLGTAALVGGPAALGTVPSETPDGDVTVTVDDACSSATIEMRPPDSETWTGVVEYVEDGSAVGRTPEDGRTVAGGSVASLAVSFASPGTRVRRAVVVRGTDLDGEVVAENRCESSDGGSERDGQNECGTGGRSGGTSRSTNEGAASGVDADSTRTDSVVRAIRDGLGLAR